MICQTISSEAMVRRSLSLGERSSLCDGDVVCSRGEENFAGHDACDLGTQLSSLPTGVLQVACSLTQLSLSRQRVCTVGLQLQGKKTLQHLRSLCKITNPPPLNRFSYFCSLDHTIPSRQIQSGLDASPDFWEHKPPFPAEASFTSYRPCH